MRQKFTREDITEIRIARRTTIHDRTELLTTPRPAVIPTTRDCFTRSTTAATPARRRRRISSEGRMHHARISIERSRSMSLPAHGADALRYLKAESVLASCGRLTQATFLDELRLATPQRGERAFIIPGRHEGRPRDTAMGYTITKVWLDEAIKLTPRMEAYVRRALTRQLDRMTRAALGIPNDPVREHKGQKPRKLASVIPSGNMPPRPWGAPWGAFDFMGS